MSATRPAVRLPLALLAGLMTCPQSAVAQEAIGAAEKQRFMAFQQQVQDLSSVYDPIMQTNVALLDEGKVSESTQQLLDAVPESQRTAAHDFLLGNLLFDMEPALSLKLHERALEADPDNVMIAEEWALDLHRAGRWAEAEATYAKLLAHPAFQASALHALQAETLLQLGRPADAVAEWKQLDVKRQHTDIEETLGWVHGPVSPWMRRADLLAGVASKQPDAARDLILLDLHFDRNWWNEKRRDDYLAADLARVDDAFGPTAPRVRELHALVLLEQTMPADPMERAMGGKPDADVVAKARDAVAALKLIGPDARDAADAAVGDRIFAAMVLAGIQSWSQIVADHQDRLQARVRSLHDPAALRTLSGLLEAARSEELAELDRFGWEKYGDASCAASLLAASLRDGKPDEALLGTALAKHPDDPRLLRLAVQFDEHAGRLPLAERLSTLILASAKDVPDARGLDALYLRLGDALAAPK
ncbi:MAG TPA: hypothetical protein VFY71_13965 [Planctomycetota bacterium]|nr:hypothetical protein [Planctomycetota bacterium]